MTVSASATGGVGKRFEGFQRLWPARGGRRILRQPAVRREMLVSQVLRLVGWAATLVPVVAQAAPQEPRRRARQQRATSPFRLPRRAVRVATEAGSGGAGGDGDATGVATAGGSGSASAAVTATGGDGGGEFNGNGGGGLAARRRRLVSQPRSEAGLRQLTRQQRAVTQATPTCSRVCQAGERSAVALPEAASAGQHRSRMRLEARPVRRSILVAAVRAGRPQPIATRTPARQGTRHRPRRRPAAQVGLAYRRWAAAAAVPPQPIAPRMLARQGTRHRPPRRPAAQVGIGSVTRAAAVPPRPAAMRRRQAAVWRWPRRSRQEASAA